MTMSVWSARRRRKPGVDFHSSGGIYRTPVKVSPMGAAAEELSMGADNADTIEVRISRWMTTGEGEHSLLLDITALVEQQRDRLYAKFGEHNARDVVDAGAGHIWEEVKSGKFDCSRSFSPWLSVVLRNACSDERRRRKRHAKPFTVVFQDDYDDGVAESPDTADDLSIDYRVRIANVASELERLLDDAEKRLLFAVAAGLAEHLDRAVLDRWCAEIKHLPGLRSAIYELLQTPVHGRQEALAPHLNITAAACRKRFQRAWEKLEIIPLFKDLRRLMEAAEPLAD